MILVDTSVLISFLAERDDPGAAQMEEVLERRLPFGICPPVYQEVLQGAASEKDYSILREYLDSQVMYSLGDSPDLWGEAALLSIKCRRRGFRIGTVDALIAETAIHHDLYLLHNDRDYDRIASVDSRLRLLSLS